MISNKADCVLGEERLISSANRKLQKTAPSRNSVSLVTGFIMVKPVMSDGMTSGVSCRRLNFPLQERATEATSWVFPTPGTSSIRMWPPASMAVSSRAMEVRLPTITFSTLSITADSFSFSIRFSSIRSILSKSVQYQYGQNTEFVSMYSLTFFPAFCW